MAIKPSDNPIKPLASIYDREIKRILEEVKNERLSKEGAQVKSDGKGLLVQFPATSSRGGKKKRAANPSQK